MINCQQECKLCGIPHSQEEDFMLIGEVCSKAGVTRELIRHYEQLGLISSNPVQAGSRSYRHFDQDVLFRLSLIQKGKSIGLSLKQIKPLLDAFLNNQISEDDAQQVLHQQLIEMERVIRQAEEVKQLIQQHIDKISAPSELRCDSLNQRLRKAPSDIAI